MRTVDRDLDRILYRLRTLIRQQGYTQLEVQGVLGWGRNYISQILTKQKSLRLDQILLILKVIEIDPADFFGEIYPFSEAHPGRQTAPSISVDLEEEIQLLGALYEGLVGALKRRGVITAEELAAAIKERTETKP